MSKKTKPSPKLPKARAVPKLPEPFPRSYTPYQIHDGLWLVLSDVHLPYHDVPAIEAAIRVAKKRKIMGVLLNGDMLDSHEISRFDKDPSKPRYQAELKAWNLFATYLRYQFPTADVVFKEGNHEERLYSYLMQKAPALFGLEETSLPTLMKLEKHGIQHVGDCRVVRIGKLNLIHGHEYKPNIQTPVNPARGLFLRTKGLAACGHFHQTSEHHEPTITMKPQGCWSTGCLCQLNPPYMPLNKWNHGFCLIDCTSKGDFHVENFRIMDGKVL